MFKRASTGIFFYQIETYLHTPWLKTLCLGKLKPTIGFEKICTFGLGVPIIDFGQTALNQGGHLLIQWCQAKINNGRPWAKCAYFFKTNGGF